MPKKNKREKRGREKLSPSVFLPKADLFDKDVPEAVEFRRLYLRLRDSKNLFEKSSSTSRSFLITSAVHEEGKTTIASCLGLTFARFDSGSTLLIDGDVRRPRIHKIFGLERRPGLLDLLADSADYQGCIKDSGLYGLKILTSGDDQIKASEAIEKKKISMLLSDLAHSFDNVIVDVPPVFPVVDSLIWGAEVDMTLMVVMMGKTPKEVVQHAKDMLVNAKANLTGILLNNVNNTRAYYYNYGHHGYPKYYREESKSYAKHE